MSAYTVRAIEPGEFKGIFRQIQKDFSPGEYAPYEALRRQIQDGIQDGLVLQRQGIDVAYAICAAAHENGFVLVSLLAVYPPFRAGGCGSAFLAAIQETYREKNGILVEVEKPEEASDGGDRQLRLRRMEFYRRAGFLQVPGIDYSIWGIPMHLMAFPQKIPIQRIDGEILPIIRGIYRQLLGERYLDECKIRRLGDGPSAV